MQEHHASSAVPSETSLTPIEGWHCSHFYYRFDRRILAQLDHESISAGKRQFLAILDPNGPDAAARMQVGVVSGHKADFGLMALDADPLRVQGVHQRLLACELGPALMPTYSFVSMTEVSEYVPTVEVYGERLRAGGESADSPAYAAKVRTFAEREPRMRRQRLTPDLPGWPATCFYPMNKKRAVGENWFLLPFADRNRLMADHARSGMDFADRVTQLITVGVGLDDWEWGVTLWARNPQFLREIVYRMRFDEASARYGEFGPFHAGFVLSADAVLRHCRVGREG
ncbi:MAG: heme-dependent peroxidase [Planctomycetes bacterium]|nr:heme-dependent peroxidase [Planctomycetota bacterium]